MVALVRILTFAAPSKPLRRVACWVLLASVLALLAPAAGRAQSRSGGVGPGSGSGEALYAEGCQSCHGISGQGVSGIGPRIGTEGQLGAGPPLVDVAPGTIDLYLSTGYMPLDNPRDAPQRKDPTYDPQEIRALVRYVSRLGEKKGTGGASEAGPSAPVELPNPDPAAGSVSEGQELFTENCAGCHQVVGEGGVIGQAVAPELRGATDQQVAEAVRGGPYLMPHFSERQISDDQLDSIVAYVGYTRDPQDEGGWGIGHIGPIPEGLGAWIVAAVVLVGVARWIGKRTGKES